LIGGLRRSGLVAGRRQRLALKVKSFAVVGALPGLDLQSLNRLWVVFREVVSVPKIEERVGVSRHCVNRRLQMVDSRLILLLLHEEHTDVAVDLVEWQALSELLVGRQ